MRIMGNLAEQAAREEFLNWVEEMLSPDLRRLCADIIDEELAAASSTCIYRKEVLKEAERRHQGEELKLEEAAAKAPFSSE